MLQWDILVCLCPTIGMLCIPNKEGLYIEHSIEMLRCVCL